MNNEYSVTEVESDLRLLGVTGVEDVLQEDVVKCVRDFQEAGIKVWMITGDKGDTAQQIGYSCGLFHRDEFKIYRIEEGNSDVEG